MTNDDKECRLDITGNLEAFKRQIKGRTVGVCLQGKSLEKLEENIKSFRGLDICWVGQNRYDLVQFNILNQIKEQIKVVLEIATVRYNDEYNKIVRIPRIEKFLQLNSQGIILTTDIVFNGMRKAKELLCINPKVSCMFLDIANSNLSIPNSLTLYLLLLAHYGAKQIILFGFDGFGNPEAFRKERIDSDLIKESWYRNVLDTYTYYKPELVERDRRIGFGTTKMSALFSDSPAFNDQFLGIYEEYCKDYKIEPIKIWNCNPNSMFTLFEKISYEKAIKLCL